jgi:hypothetical protein
MRWMNCRGEATKLEVPDEPTVNWRALSVYPMAKFKKDRDAQRLKQ